jgi:hypothetical protein
MMMLGETSELSFEPTIEGRFDRSSRDVPSGVAKKSVGADLDVNHCDMYRRQCSLLKHERSTSEDRTVCDLAQRLGFLLTNRTVHAWWTDGPRVRRGDEVCQQHLDLAPGNDSSWRRDLTICLVID